jgi:hypothetical protein
VFARAELFAVRDDAEQLVATGDVILVPLAAGGDGAFTNTASARSPADASVR